MTVPSAHSVDRARPAYGLVDYQRTAFGARLNRLYDLTVAIQSVRSTKTVKHGRGPARIYPERSAHPATQTPYR